MNRNVASVIALNVAAFSAAPALASGNIAAGELAQPLYETTAPATTSTTSRAQVQAELAQAVRSGTLVVSGEIGAVPRQAQAVEAQVAATKSRQQVRAETVEAARAGDIVTAGSLAFKRNARTL